MGFFNRKKALNSLGSKKIIISISEGQRIELQESIYKIYQDVCSISEKLGITPFLIGGSALGAIRHHDFIPWDDDLDIGMIRKDYDVFVSEFAKIYSAKYIVNSPNVSNDSKARFTKIIKRGTIYRELNGSKVERLNGIFVDVFPIDNVPDKPLQKKIKGICCNVLEFISSQVFMVANEDELDKRFNLQAGKLDYFIRHLVGKAFSFRPYSRWFDLIDKIIQYRDEGSAYVTIAPGRKHYFGEIIRRADIFPVRYVDFHGGKAVVFANVEDYLTKMYGNYMEIPSVEKRESHFIRELKL